MRDTARASQPPTDQPTGHWICLHGLALIDQKCQIWSFLGIFAQKRPNLAQNWHFWSILARPCRLIWCFVGGSFGGCDARAVSRKTPIYFILLLLLTYIELYHYHCYIIHNLKGESIAISDVVAIRMRLKASLEDFVFKPMSPLNDSHQETETCTVKKRRRRWCCWEACAILKLHWRYTRHLVGWPSSDIKNKFFDSLLGINALNVNRPSDTAYPHWQWWV